MALASRTSEQVNRPCQRHLVALVGQQLLRFGDSEPAHPVHLIVVCAKLAQCAADRYHQVVVDGLVDAAGCHLHLRVTVHDEAALALLLVVLKEGEGIVNWAEAGDDARIQASLLLHLTQGSDLAGLTLLDFALRQTPIVIAVTADQQYLIAKLVLPHAQPPGGGALHNQHPFCSSFFRFSIGFKFDL